MSEKVLVLGAGYVGANVARLARARGFEVLTFVRSAERTAALAAEGFDVLRAAALDPSIGEKVDARTHVVITFPADGRTDQAIAPVLDQAASITYVSTTGVYDDLRGVVDDATPVPAEPSERSNLYLAAEAAYRQRGGTVLRCPGIYGAERGLHVRVLSGKHRIPGDGERYLSRIHVLDLAELLLAATRVRGETFVVGDLEPAPHVEVVRFICREYGLDMPPFESLSASPLSLRADRRIDPSRALRLLGVALRYPTYREGMAASATRLSPRP